MSDTIPPESRANSPRAAIWLTPDQEPLARTLVDRLGLHLVAVGVPAGGRLTRSELLGQPATDDLRCALNNHPDAILIMLSVGEEERSALAAGASLPRGVLEATAPVFSLDPILTNLASANRLLEDHPRWVARLHDLPAMIASAGGAGAIASLENFGRIRSLDLACRSAATDSTLTAILLDAMTFVAVTLGEPEFIDASLSGVEANSGLRLTAGDALTSIAGDLTAHLRFADDRAAALSLSNRAGTWFRGVTLLGPGGCIRFDDERFEWRNTTGELIDESAPAAGSSLSRDALICNQAAAILENRFAPAPPKRRLDALLFAEAALLSSRTGQPESTATVRRMAGIPG